MFRKHPIQVEKLVKVILRSNGLETPWLQRRLIEAWDNVTGETVARYTTEKYIRNQTLFVHIENPALRSGLNMSKNMLIKCLNTTVGAQVITDIRLV